MADILGFMRKAFPFISAAASLGGPPAVLAAGLIGKALGASSPPDPSAEGISQAVLTALQKDPSVAVALDKAEKDFQVQMGQLQLQLEDLSVQDTASARAREIAVRDRTPRILAYVIIAGFMGMAYGVLFHRMQADSALAGAVIGYLSAKAELVASYYFGSSHGSDAKNEVIAEAMHKQNGS